MSEKYQNGCPIMNTLNKVGGKWKLPILWQLYNDDLRYNELKRRLDGITNIMLTRCLQDLEKENLVNRLQISDIPPHVEYSLTEHCRNLADTLLNLEVWEEKVQSMQNSKM